MKALENYKVSKDCEFLCVNLHNTHIEMVAMFLHWFICFPQTNAEHNVFFQMVLNGEVWVGLTKKMTEEKNSEILFPWQVEVQRCYCSTYCSYLLNPNSSQITA